MQLFSTWAFSLEGGCNQCNFLKQHCT